VECDEPTDPSSTGTASITDNCGGAVDITYTDLFTPGSCPQESTIARTWTAVDDCGNFSTCVQTITIVDATPPVIQEIPDVVQMNDPGQCGANVNYPVISAKDNCSGEVIHTFDIPSGSFFLVGSTTVTVTATDACGNSSTAQMVVVVNDTEPPDIIAPDFISQPNDPGLCGADITLNQPTVADNCGVATINNDAPVEFPIGQTVVTWTAMDIQGNKSTATSIVEVTDLPLPPNEPVISAPVDPVPINTTIDVSAISTDNNVQSGIWDWGHNGETSGASIVHTSFETEFYGQHSYSEAGVYTITLTVTECDEATSSSTYQYVVVYDPSAGFVTGGGWINSLAGAYTPDPSLQGKANFGFVSKYKKGTTVPIGNTDFQFKAGDLNFKSNVYDWLVIAGSKAMFKGSGTINGNGDYGFMLSAIDGDLNTNTIPDKFRIKIWDKSEGDVVVYDNQVGDADDADPTTELGGGSIVIHKSKTKSATKTISKVIIYPNPFDNSINIDLFSEASHSIIIDMIDMNGRVVEYLYTGLIVAELDHHFEFNTKADLTPGSYMLRIRTENGELLGREIIIKR
jgi:hypothetical protein